MNDWHDQACSESERVRKGCLFGELFALGFWAIVGAVVWSWWHGAF